MQNDAFKVFVIELLAIESGDQTVTRLEHLRGCWYSKLKSRKQLDTLNPHFTNFCSLNNN